MADKSVEAKVGEAVLKSGVGQDIAKSVAKKEANNLRTAAKNHFWSYKWHYLGIAIYLAACLVVLVVHTIACPKGEACNNSLWRYGIRPRKAIGLIGLPVGVLLVSTWLGLVFLILIMPWLAIRIMMKGLIEFFVVLAFISSAGGLFIWGIGRQTYGANNIELVHPNIPAIGFATYLITADLIKYGLNWAALLRNAIINFVLLVVIVASSFGSVATLSWEGFIGHGLSGIGFAFLWHFFGTRYIYPFCHSCFVKIGDTCCGKKGSVPDDLTEVVEDDDLPVGENSEIDDDDTVISLDDRDARDAAKLTAGV